MKKTMEFKDYFFYEWMIIEKKITAEEFEKFTLFELVTLKSEYNEFMSTLK